MTTWDLTSLLKYGMNEWVEATRSNLLCAAAPVVFSGRSEVRLSALGVEVGDEMNVPQIDPLSIYF